MPRVDNGTAVTLYMDAREAVTKYVLGLYLAQTCSCCGGDLGANERFHKWAVNGRLATAVCTECAWVVNRLEDTGWPWC